MKFSTLLLLAFAVFRADAFAPSNRSPPTTQHCTSLAAVIGGNDNIDRRALFGEGLLALVAGSALLPSAASAASYQPKYEDLRQIYGLGASLDTLAEKIADETSNRRRTVDGLHSFNKDLGFFPAYARNYVGKIVKLNADGDPRNGYIREAVDLISSCEGLLEGEEEGLAGKDADSEAIRRVRKAQTLISRFLAESGVNDEKVTAFVAAHP